LQATALATLLRALPATAALKTFHRRERIGMGSLGKPRFMVIGTYNGAAVAREAKSLVGPPTQWYQEQPPLGSRIGELLKQVVRAPDPMYRTDGDWIVRRLAPHCVRLELSELTQSKALTCVLTSMGAETANIHAGTPDATASILKDIERLPSNWLAAAAKHGAKLLMHDWKRWRQIHTGPDGDALAGAS
jgi:hypothetical protein